MNGSPRWRSRIRRRLGLRLGPALERLARRLQGDEARTQRVEERYRLALECDSDAIWDWDLRSDRCWFAPNWQRIIGFSDAQMASYQWPDHVHPDDYPESQRAMRAHFDGASEQFQIVYRHRRGAARDEPGEWLWIEARGRCQRDADGRPVRFTGHLRDIHRQTIAERALRDSEALLAESQRIALLGSWSWDLDSGRMHWPAQSRRIAGLDAAAPASAEVLWQVVHPADHARLRELARAVSEGDGDYDIEYRILRADTGELRWLRSRARAMRDADGRLLRLLGTVQDITAHKENEERIRRLAYYDDLTGLPNRALFRQQLEQTCRASRETGQPAALMFIDLDRFKQVNDSLGHAAGDELLRRVARRLSRGPQGGDLIARLGGDEFTVLMPRVAGEAEVTRRARDLLAELSRPCDIQGHPVHPGGSIGITLCPRDGDTPETLLRHADMAMYAAKSAGRNTLAYFTPALHRRARQLRKLEARLRQLLAKGALEVHYQPIVALASGQIESVEALLRFRDAHGGLQDTEAVIAVAEDAGLIDELFAQVLQRACADTRHWRRADGRAMSLAINAASLQFHQGFDEQALYRDLLAADFDPARLILEITESTFIDHRRDLRETLQSLRRRGLRIALDDFGSGYSSLGYLRRFPVDILKIDRGFISDLDADGNHDALVEAVLSMARSLSLEVVAEGVENARQARQLQRLGCRWGQGFHWSPALPASHFESLLERQTG